MGFIELLKDAKRELSMADHINSVALPVVQDKNVFLSVLEHLDKGVYLGIRAYLSRQKELKKLRIFPESEDLSRRLFFQEYAKKIGLSTSEMHILNELNILVRAHRKNMNEIKRGDNYIIFLPNFETVTVNQVNLKRYLSTARVFINGLERGLT